MGLFSSAFGPSASVGDHDGWLMRAIGGGKTAAGTQVSEWNAIQFPAVYGAVTLISDSMAQLPLHVYRKDGRTRHLADDHPADYLLSCEPNERMNSFVWRETTQSHSLLWGNGYAYMEFNNRGRLTEIIPLLPDRTRPELDGRGDVWYRTSIDSQPYTFPADRVLHIPALGFDGLMGYSPVSVMRENLGYGFALQEFGSRFFSNDAKSGGFIKHPTKLSEPAKKNLQDSFGQQGGLGNSHKLKILEEGMEFQNMTIPPEDAQFLESRRFAIEDVARMYRVPLHELQSNEKSTSWGSGIEQMTLGMISRTLMPWIVRWEMEFKRKLFTRRELEQGYYVKFNVDALLRGDMKTRGDYHNLGINGGWKSRNEARENEDMDPRPGLDRMLVPENMRELDESGEPILREENTE